MREPSRSARSSDTPTSLPTGGPPATATPTGYANMPVTKAPAWHAIIAWDAMFNGMAMGLFLAAGISELALPAIFTPVAKLAYPVSLVLLLADLIMLVLDLGDSSRFHHMLRVFKPGSPMSVGTWSLTLFSLPLTAVATLSVLAEMGIDFEKARIFTVIVGLLPGFAAAAYKGVLLSTNAQPGWKDARWLGGYLTNSALLLGCAEMLVLSALIRQTQAVAILRTAFIVLLLLNLIPLALLLTNLQPTFARLYTREQQWSVAVLVFTVGTLIPLSFTLLSGSLLFVFGAVMLVFLQTWVVRFMYIKIPHASTSRAG